MKLSDMGCADLQGGRIVDVQELRFQVAKRLDMGCAVRQRESICSYLGRAFSGCEKFRYGV